jgi:hypothetical protein
MYEIVFNGVKFNSDFLCNQYMAKGGSRSKGSSDTGSNGGILGSGIFGLFGTTIKCEATDTSMYCTFMKFVNILIAAVMIFAILYLGYTFIYPYIKHVRR